MWLSISVIVKCKLKFNILIINLSPLLAKVQTQTSPVVIVYRGLIIFWYKLEPTTSVN